jgi:nitrogen regulatory protein PII
MVKVEAIVVRDRVETVMDAVEEHTGHVGVTVIEAVGHGRQRGITHEAASSSRGSCRRRTSSSS